MKKTYTKYLELKQKYQDGLLFVRLGDFLETFVEDAEIVAKELDLTITSRNCGEYGKVKLTGFPYISMDQYINKLILKGYKVAYCEELPDPKTIEINIYNP